MRKSLKLTILSAFLIITTGFKTTAQHEAKINVLGMLFNQFGATYEYVINENMGVLGSVSYFTPPSSFSYDYKAFALTPEFRYYFNPDEDASGYFAGAYLKYRNTSSDEYTTINNNGSQVPVSQKTNGMALGITTGHKWVTRSGLLFETWVGIGRYLFDSESYSNGYDPDEFQTLVDDLPSWDFRIGITVGWRFGR